MADKHVQFDASDLEKDPCGVYTQVFNIYNTYANALAHGENGLMTVSTVDLLDGTADAAVTQVARVTGIQANVDGLVNFIVDDANAEVWVACEAGRFGAPRRVIV